MDLPQGRLIYIDFTYPPLNKPKKKQIQMFPIWLNNRRGLDNLIGEINAELQNELDKMIGAACSSKLKSILKGKIIKRIDKLK